MSDRPVPYLTHRAVLQVFSTRVGSTTCVEISGELDVATETRLTADLDRLVDRGARVLLLDMSMITFCDSTILRVLASTEQRLWTLHGRVRIVDHSECVARLLQLTGFDHLVDGPPR